MPMKISHFLTSSRHSLIGRTAFATYYIDAGNYNATAAQLEAIEPALLEAQAFTVSGTATDWEASALSGSGTTFTIRLPIA